MKLQNLNIGPIDTPDFDIYLYEVEFKRLATMDALSPEYWHIRTELLNKIGTQRPDLFSKYFQFDFSKTGDML